MPLATGQIAQILPKKTATWPSCGRRLPLPYSICRSCNFNWTTHGYHTVVWYGYHLSAPSNYIKQLRHISLILRQEKSNKNGKDIAQSMSIRDYEDLGHNFKLARWMMMMLIARDDDDDILMYECRLINWPKAQRLPVRRCDCWDCWGLPPKWLSNYSVTCTTFFLFNHIVCKTFFPYQVAVGSSGVDWFIFLYEIFLKIYL